MKYAVIVAIVVVLAVFLLSGCGAPSVKAPAAYKRVSTDEAVKMMENESDFIILDVRTKDEYASGHIPGALCVPNETIGNSDIPELPDKEQLIFVYCRSGSRSRQASQKLADMGYSNVVDFGGINSWTGEVEE